MGVGNSMVRKKGFTIVELLIVVVVIAILATIVVVAYNGIQKRATAAQYESNAQTIAKKADIFSQETGKYPTSASSIQYDTTGTSSLPSGLRIAFTTVGTTSMTNRVCSTTTDPSGLNTYICSMYRNTTTGAITHIARECPYSTDSPTTSAGTGFRLFYVDPLDSDLLDVKYITVGAGCT